MVVITLEKCPASLRGDLSKWLQEISLGVYVGQVSARVRDELWKRICEESKNGRATMVFSAQTEQRYDFRVHNTSWEPIDFDGIKLMMRPSPARIRQADKKRTGFSNASKRRKACKRLQNPKPQEPTEYVVFDLETTGTNPEKDEIIEIAAIKYVNGREIAKLHFCVCPTGEVPRPILELTGLTPDALSRGSALREAMQRFIDFADGMPLVAHNAPFDIEFLQNACSRLGMDELDNEVVDTLELAKRMRPGLESYRLERLVDYLGLERREPHRALPDALTTRQLFVSLVKTD